MQSPYSMPPAVKNLLIVNILFFIACIVFKSTLGISLEKYLGLSFLTNDNFKIYQFVTYMFLHDYPNPMHIFFNMFALYMFGRTLEMVWGTKRFLLFYFITGIGAGLIQEVVFAIGIYQNSIKLTPELVALVKNEGYGILQQNLNYANEYMGKLNRLYNTVTVGASGSIYGLLLAFGMLFPNTVLMLMFPPIPLKAKYMVIAFAAISLWLGISGRVQGVAHFAHLGGMLFGFFLIWRWKKKGNLY